jgi:ubiquinone/menaquinone biosynthesis C-methylase UbiE
MDFSDDSVKKIFGERANQYTTSSSHTDPLVLGRLCELSHPQKDWNVLDVATGTGHTAFAFAPFVHDVIGIDLTPEMLNEAELLKQKNGLQNVEFHVGNVHHLLYPDNQFDLVTCRRSPHHFSNITLALKEMFRVLKPMGILAIDDRISPENDFLDKTMNTLDKLHDISHVREYRQSEWLKMLNDAKFQVIQTESYTKHRPISAFT